MTRIVMKFGGSSVATSRHMRAVAKIVRHHWLQGDEIAVVVSAMGSQTDRLVDIAKDVGAYPGTREYDAIVACGEQLSAPILASVLIESGVPARSWAGWQIPVHTTAEHGAARVERIEGENLIERFDNNREVAVVTGFQGIDAHRQITTLGRGGSDLSAVVLAAALKADRCDIYTDVDGVYTTDPRIARRARRIDEISYQEMLELSALGARVLQARSVSAARTHEVPLRVRSTFNATDEGTLVTYSSEMEKHMELRKVTGIAHDHDQAKVTCRGIPDAPGMAARIFGPLSDAGVIVDMIVQTASVDGKSTDITFTVPMTSVTQARAQLIAQGIPEESIICDEEVVKISVVGAGMQTAAGVAADVFRVLFEKNINIHVISTSEIKMSVLVHEEYCELAVRSLHAHFIEN